MKLFGTDGIRGKAGEYPLDTETIYVIGQTAAHVLMKKDTDPTIIIGRDTRESGKAIVATLKKGLSDSGVDVIDLGVIPTPGVSHAVKHNPVLAGIVISASHNPYMDNGIKFFGPNGTKLSDKIEALIEKKIKESPTAKKSKKKGIPEKKSALYSKKSIEKKYIEFLTGTISEKCGLKGMKLVLDCANGATYSVASKVFKLLGAEVTMVNDVPNGRNINLECGALHPENISKEVVRQKASCGLAFDGDGDRIIFCDEKGNVRDGDYLLSIASLFLKKNNKLKNNTLVTTVMANLGLFRAMERNDINVIQTSVGDKYVYEAMVNSGAAVGGEQSGHLIFSNYLPTGDGILSALQILGSMKETGKPLSVLCEVMQKYPQVLINTHVGNRIPVDSLPMTLKMISKVENKLKSDGRVLVRYSGTENLLRVMVEGLEKDMITEMANDISKSAKNEIAGMKLG